MKSIHLIALALALIPSQSFAQPDAARVVEVSGDATVTKGKGSPTPLTPLMSLDEGAEVQTGRAGYVKLMLADKSVIELGAYGKLRLSEAKENNQVDLGLDSGRLKARVEHRVDKKRTFVVRTKTSTMGVRGTEFVIAIFQGSKGLVNSEYYCQSGSIEVNDKERLSSALVGPGYGISVAEHPGDSAAKREVAQIMKPHELSAKTLEEVMSKNFLLANPAPPVESPPPATQTLNGNGGDATKASRQVSSNEPNLPAEILGGGAANIEIQEIVPENTLLAFPTKQTFPSKTNPSN